MGKIAPFLLQRKCLWSLDLSKGALDAGIRCLFFVHFATLVTNE
ncbi:hypothetical protein Pan241w_21470 [Gimesia alba]|uniref:Uncharacterized protein n=1 Tax=Gimesia alba TaxID=2527973 RepID=A0A517RDY4_9PLAN|nr:hypothetical protein Pan241w_21470 [Gimesia alba]